jgi:hypothetical protein
MNDQSKRVELLREKLAEVNKALQRLFYLNLAISLIVLYVISESLDISPLAPRQQRPARESVRQHLANLEPLFEVGDYLQKHPQIVHDYRAFLRPYLAVEDAATQAVAGVDYQDPKWLALNHEDRQIVRDLPASLEAQLTFTLDSYDFDDLRWLPVSYLLDFHKTFVFPEQLFSNQHVLEQLHASLRVANAFDMPVTVSTWPESFYFLDFVDKQDVGAELGNVIRGARQEPNVSASVRALEQVCEANDVEYCSVNQVESLMAAGELKLVDTGDEAEKIEISFVPIGVTRYFFIGISPIALLFSFHIFLAHYRKRSAIEGALTRIDDKDSDVERKAPWLLGYAQAVPSEGTPFLVRTQILLLRLFFVVGVVLPLVGQAGVSTYLWTRQDLAATAVWAAAASACFVLSAVSFLTVGRDARRMLDPRVWRSSPREEK